MATSTLTLYKTKITPQRNALIDDLETYLASIDATDKTEVDNFQYQKIELDKVIKVQLAQEYQAKMKYNYCRIYQDNKAYYYFIVSANQKSESVVEFTLSIDSINTFRNDFTFSDKTNVIREHRSRFKSSDRFVTGPGTSYTLHRVVDNIDEGITPVLFKDSDGIVQEDKLTARQDWYLIYQTRIQETGDNNKPLEVYLVPKTSVHLINTPDTFSFTVDGSGSGPYYYFLRETNPDFNCSINGNYYNFTDAGQECFAICIYRQAVNQVDICYIKGASGFDTDLTHNYENGSVVTINYSDEAGRRLSVKTCNQQKIKSQSATTPLCQCGTTNSMAINDIDRSDSTIVSIIEIPYLPDNITWNNQGYIDLTNAPNWEVQGNKLHLKVYTAEFEHKLKSNYPLPDLEVIGSAPSLDDLKNQLRQNKYESKLFNSSFYTMKYNYDTFNTSIAYERLGQETNNHQIDLYFKPSNALTSELAFKWELKNGETYKSSQDYENFLISNRNNSIGLYNSEYLNYLRTAYNYDLKNKNLQNAQGHIAAAASIAGATVAAFASVRTGGLSLAVAASLGITAITTTSNAVTSTITAEQELQQKLDGYANQAASVSNATSVDLLNWYNDNKLHIIRYLPSSKAQDNIVNLFHYCGYATNNQKTPILNSRYWFNYIQCEPVFKNENANGTYDEFLDDVKARYASGVTIYHYHNEYDWDQKYENWENTLFY